MDCSIQQGVNEVRVLHYIGTLELGGSQAFVMELYRNINRDRVQFDFVTFPGWRGPLYDEIISLGGRVFECPKYNGANHFAFVKWWDSFLSQHTDYLVVHGHVRSVASIYLPIVRKHNRYAILHSHSISNGRGVKAAIKAFLQRHAGRIADYYMACSDEAGRWLFGEKTIKSAFYMTIPNAINIQRFIYSTETRDIIRKRYNIGDSFIIGHVGRLESVKNQHFLLEILEALIVKHRVLDVVLVLVGDGALRDDLMHEAARRKISNQVIFAGNRIDTEQFYSAMDMFAFPSKWEGLGIAAVEAQVSGLKCLISQGIPDKVDIGAGLVEKLSLEDVNEWCEHILEIKNEQTSSEYLRTSHIEEAIQAGYDVRQNARFMEDFYYQKAKTISDASR